jgi:hypothetical protein
MIKKIIVLFFSLWVLTGCFANNMKNNAVNETWVEEQQLYDALIEAADKNYKNYYFIDLRSQTDYNTAFIEGFVNQSRENLQIFLEDASQWNMIILMSEDTEKTNEAVAYVEGLGFDNAKYVFISLERLFTFFESKNMIMEVTPNGDICPIENPEGC